MNFYISAATDIGPVKKTNQDSYCVRSYRTSQGPMVFAILCDGMGGLAKGEVASASVINAYLNWTETRLPQLCAAPLDPRVIREEWRKLAIQYNEKIKYHGSCCGVAMGTTLTAILLTEHAYYVINVGDSRTYELADSLRQITRDHSFVAREMELGRMTPQEAKTDPRRNVLLQCIGASETVEPDFFTGPTVRDGVYFLCSDGFRHEITPEEISVALRPTDMSSEERMEERLRQLIELNKARHERDNISVVAIRTY